MPLNDSSDEIAAHSRIEICFNDIKIWMNVNKLKLNDDKTELLLMSLNTINQNLLLNRSRLLLPTFMRRLSTERGCTLMPPL